MRLFRKALIFTHRYIGLAIGLLVVMWFATGIVMMYAGGMPRLEADVRLERLAPVDLSQVHLTPAQAMEKGEVGGEPDRTLLLTVTGRPAYRFTFGRDAVTVFADTGDLFNELTLEQSRAVAGAFMRVPAARVHHLATIDEPDQWTLLQGRQMPQHKFRIDDEEATELYVYPATGDVSVLTTRKSRALAWMGTIPHWLYFTALRVDQALWYRLVVWTSTIACVLAVLGLMLAYTQFRRTRPLRNSIPYAGMMRWHYVTGAIFGIFTLTWAFSGLLSMEPYAWTNAEGLRVDRDVMTGGPVDLTRYGAMDPGAWSRVTGGRAIKEIQFARIQDQHYYVVRHALDARGPEALRERLHQPYNVTGRREENRLIVAADTLAVRTEPFSVESVVSRLKAGLPDVPIVETQLLAEYDSYYYSRAGQTPLPVVRVKFADPGATWVYIDPEMSQVLASVHRLNRVERWLYNGLHSLDFRFWYDTPAWWVGMVILLLGGLTTSVLGLTMGIKRLTRGTARTARSLAAGSIIPPSVRPKIDAPAARTMNS